MAEKFQVVLLRAGEQRDGVDVTPEVLKGLDGTELPLLDVDRKPTGITVKARFDEGLGILVAEGEIPEETPKAGLTIDLLVLAQKAPDLKVVTDDNAERRDNDKDFDESFPSRVVEVWYDLKEWWRYVRNQTRQRADRGQEEKWVDHFLKMDIIGETETPLHISDRDYHGEMNAAKSGHHYAKVKNIKNESHWQAEDQLLLAIQAASKAGAPRGRIVRPTKMLSEFEVIA